MLKVESPDTALAEPHPVDQPLVITRRRIDRVLIAVGALAAVVFAVAGALLMWGASFSDDYVHRELTSQRITMPDEATLRQRYEQEKSRFVEPEQRLVSHILVPVEEGAGVHLAGRQVFEEQARVVLDAVQRAVLLHEVRHPGGAAAGVHPDPQPRDRRHESQRRGRKPHRDRRCRGLAG